MSDAPTVTLEFCKGSNAGQAFYMVVNYPDGSGMGTRVAGPKCWGLVNAVATCSMSLNDLDALIKAAQEAKRALTETEL